MNGDFQTLKPSAKVIYGGDYIMIIRMLTGHINLPFSVSGEIAFYSALICVSQSRSPIKFLQAAYGLASV